MSDATADDQEVEVESENEGDRPVSREVTPAAMRGPAEGEAHSPGEVESSFPDFETLLVDNDLKGDWFEPVPTRTSRSWTYSVVRRIKDPHPQWNASTSDGKNFQCLVVLPGTNKICGTSLACHLSPHEKNRHVHGIARSRD